MPRPRLKVPSQRIRFEGYQRLPIEDPRVQVAVDWYLENKAERKAFTIAWQLLIAALNGELGEGVKTAVQQGNTEEAMDALRDLMGAFGSGE